MQNEMKMKYFQSLKKTVAAKKGKGHQRASCPHLSVLHPHEKIYQFTSSHVYLGQWLISMSTIIANIYMCIHLSLTYL